MTLYIGSNKIKDIGIHGVYVGSTPINAIYNGSQKIYQYRPYAYGTVLLYGSNTGLKTYTLQKGLYQCCVVGGGIGGAWWSKAGGAAAEIQFRLTITTTVEVYSGGNSAAGYLNIAGARIVTANGSTEQMTGGSYTINTGSSYYVKTVYAKNGNGANMSTAASVSPYENWGAGNVAGGARLAYVGL